MVDLTNAVCLFDFDSAIYKAAFPCEKKQYHVTQRGTLLGVARTMTEANAMAKAVDFEEVEIEHKLFVEPVQNAYANLDNIFTATVEKFPCDWEVYLTGSNNFRHKLATIQEYKGQRKLKAKPVHYEALRQRAIKKYNAIVIDNMEADDELAIRSEELLAVGKTPILVTIDKDIDQVPGYHYNWNKEEMRYIPPFEACRSFYKQLLMGDNSDNIPGLAGVGDKTADKILANCKTEKDLHKATRDMYVKHHGEAAVDGLMKEIGTLLWLQRTRDISSWQPSLSDG